jgi:formate--tetrahydrofolate ligase
VEEFCKGYGVKAILTEVWAKGGAGAIELARAVCEAAETGAQAQFTYPDDMSLYDKIDSVARKIYGADGIELDEGVAEQLQQFEKLGMGNWPVCIANWLPSVSTMKTT